MQNPTPGTLTGRKGNAMRGVGRVVFVAILLLTAGTLNIIDGIAAVSNAHFFDGTQYAFSSLHTWGWIGIIVGIIQLTGGFSLFGSGAAASSGSSQRPWARSSRCSRSAASTRGGRLGSSWSASGSSRADRLQRGLPHADPAGPPFLSISASKGRSQERRNGGFDLLRLGKDPPREVPARWWDVATCATRPRSKSGVRPVRHAVAVGLLR